MNFLASEFRKFGDDLAEAIHRDGRFARLAPMLAHFAFEVASVVDFDLDVNGFVRARMKDGFAYFVFFFGDLEEIVHGLR